MSAAKETPAALTTPDTARQRRGVLLGFFGDVALAVVIGFAMTFALSLGWGLIQGIQVAATGADEGAVGAAMTAPGAVAQISIVLLAMTTTSLLLYAWRRPAAEAERRQSWRNFKQPRTLLIATSAAIAIFVATTVISATLKQLGLPPNPSNIAVISAAFAQHPLFVSAFTILLAPLYEELLFRRVLFARFWHAGRPHLGMWLSGLAFALAHELPGINGSPLLSTLCLILVYTGMGAAFALLYWRTASLWSAILAHALNNALALGLLFAFTSS